ncbi:MAG TPA: hypothetical protein VGI40_18050 [Pirellulaceae bacterium]|jgi:hypothetical protein
MTTIASLVVSLGMETAKFTKGAIEGKKSLRDLADGMRVFQGGVGILRGVGEAIGGTINQFVNESETIRTLTALSDKTGITTQSLVVLQRAAGPAFDSLTAGLQKMGINLVHANEGSKDAQESFAKLGLDTKELAKVSQDQAFATIADKIKELPTPAEKAAAAVDIFGKSGGDLIGVLNKGSTGLAEMRKEADELGLTFDRFAGQQTLEAVKQLKEFDHIIEGVKRKIVVDAVPAFLAGGKAIKAIWDELKQGNILFAYSDAIRNVQNEYNNKPLDGTPLKKLMPKKAEPVDEIKNLADALGKSAGKDQEARDRLFGQDLSPLEQYKKKVDEISEAMTRLHNAHLLNVVDDKKYAEQQAGLKAALQRVGAAEANRRKELANKGKDDFKSLQDSLKTPGQKFAEEMAKIGDARKANAITPQQAQLAQLRAQKDLLQAQTARPQLGDRPAAVEFNSGEGIAASFGQRPADKLQAAIKKIDEQMLVVMQNIEAKLGTNYKIPG